jgi:TonB family protein
MMWTLQYRPSLAATMVIIVLASGVAAAEEPPLQTLTLARELYSAAEYDEALGVLNRLRESPSAANDLVAVEQYRAFCLLALGRSADAEQAIVALVHADPTFVPQASAIAPRMLTTFRDVRARTLPAVIQQHYDTAKAAFERREFARASDLFSGVLRVMDDPDVARAAGAPPLSDVKKLAQGFRDLSALAVAPPAPAAPTVETAAIPASSFQQPKIFTTENSDVTAPVVLRQALPPFQSPTAVTRPGVLEVVIDERGAVESAVLRASINPRYDRLVLDATRSWRYQPARRQGVPVKYRKLVQINIVKAEGR